MCTSTNVKRLLVILFYFCLTNNHDVISQQVVDANSNSGYCGTKSPGEEWEKQFQTQIQEYKKMYVAHGRAAAYVIPVVFHILYNGTLEGTIGKGANLYAGQIKSQLDILNQAFAGNAIGNDKLPAVFANVDANDVGISFCFAMTDKNGNAMTEPGINRIDWKTKGWSDPSTIASDVDVMDYFDNTIKPATIWDPTKYFNIWIADFSKKSNLYGYAKFPASSTLTLNVINSDIATKMNDGIAVASLCVGSKTTFSNGYYNTANNIRSYGHTVVHETGHWLGLRHIWGDNNCATDYCNDTPPQQGNLYALCPTHPHNVGVCSGNTTGEMFQNFMGYATDACVCLFTMEQKNRMITVMQNSPQRKLLGTHGLCGFATAAHSFENGLTDFTLSPNPSGGEVLVSFMTEGNSNYSIEVKNVVGQMIYTENMGVLTGSYAKKLDFSYQAKGVYFISLKNSYGQSIKKVVIQ
jgi:zinc-dependent metalloproteinase lipoprotein